MRRTVTIRVTLALVMGLLFLAITPAFLFNWVTPAHAGPPARPLADPGDCVVTTTIDSGAGSLRQCLLDVQAGATITFNTTIFPPGSPATITVLSELPWIFTDSVTLDGSSAGVVLDGSSLSGTEGGLRIESADNCVIKGMHVVNFPNSGISVNINATGNTIGGVNTTPGGSCNGDCNLVINNGFAGIQLNDALSTTVSGNFIGVDRSGTVAVGNNGAGIYIGPESQFNIIGGDTPGERNLISGNSAMGVSLSFTGTSTNTISGNYIGTDVSGQVAIGNANVGIFVGGGAAGNTIGGVNPGEGNLISGNGGSAGVMISDGGTRNNVVIGNIIGANAGGTLPLGNSNGVMLDSSANGNTIGGVTPGEGNLISGNQFYGVTIRGSGTSSNTVSGNYIGTNITGTGVLSNVEHGVVIEDGATFNTIGGKTAGERNLISGNGRRGIYIQINGTSNNTVIGNFIGLDAGGLAGLGNNEPGIQISNEATNNNIGDGTASGRNIISGHNQEGLSINGSGTSGNRVRGNYIGTDVNGTGAVGNHTAIRIDQGASNNTIGGNNGTPDGACTGDCNLISGNNWQGVRITEPGTVSNTISGNYIGTHVTGTTALGNVDAGIWIDDQASYNSIGGDTPSERNVISGNGYSGVTLSDSGTNYNTVSGNYIGTDSSGSYAIRQLEEGVGIWFGASYNTIGGDTPEERNLIGGNSVHGVRLWGSGTNSNTISGNYIGTNITGTGVISNGKHGVQLGDGASYNTIGGLTADERNLISGNNEHGIIIFSQSGFTTAYNIIIGNYIGTDASGTVDMGNGANGDGIGFGGNPGSFRLYNRIGGSTAAERNIISGNAGNGVYIGSSGTMSNTVSGNYIGTNAGGDTAVSNQGGGIEMGDGASYNTIGGATSGQGNLISGNNSNGIVIEGTGVVTEPTAHNTVSGNYIGTNGNGTAALRNDNSGIVLRDGAHSNLIGGDTTTERNLISGHNNSGQAGVVIDGAETVTNTVKNNYIGTDVNGTSAIPNDGGVDIRSGANNNIVRDNLLSGNVVAGITLRNNGTNNNTVAGNIIGTNAGGTATVANGGQGMFVRQGASENLIGGSVITDRNLISGNGGNGVQIADSGTVSNTIKGNYIGTNISGTVALGNIEFGVLIDSGASYNIVGSDNNTPGTCSDGCNLVSGNIREGVQITNSNLNTVKGNYIGTDINGTGSVGNGACGVTLVGSHTNQVGGDSASERNIISANGCGVALYDASGNTVAHNYIGTDPGGTLDKGNLRYGVGLLAGPGAPNNVVEHNLIAYTKFVNSDRPGAGVLVLGTNTASNTISRNSIHSNEDKGIRLTDGGNNGINRPLLTGVLTNAVAGTALANATIEIFSGSENEGRYYHGTVSADPSGDFLFNQTVEFTGSDVTATATDAAGNTSEFAINLQGSGIFEGSEQITLGTLNSQSCALGDFDIDGDQDAFCANSSPNEVWINDGFGRFTNSGQALGNNTSLAVDVGDLDGDGDLDALVGNIAGQDNIIWINDGEGQFDIEPNRVLTGSAAYTTTAVVLADLDGDRDDDVVIGNGGGNQLNQVWENNGSGQLVAVTVPAVMSNTQAVAVGDLDGQDGPDLFVVNGSGQSDQVWFNDGTGQFFDGDTADLGDSDDGQGVALGNLDDDPGLDAVVANGSGQPVVIWNNNGSGVFIVSNTLAITNSNAVAVGDLDGDGDDDVVIGSDADQPGYTAINEGGGTFTTQPIPGNQNSDSQGVALGDLDNDGDLDTFISNGDDDDGTDPDSGSTTNQVLFNLNKQPGLVGPDGGTLNFSQGMTLTVNVPAGVLTQTRIFNYTPLAQDSHPAPNDFNFAGRAFSLVGASVDNNPMTATVYFNPLAYDGNRPLLHYWEEGDEQWVDVAESCSPRSSYSYGFNWLMVSFCHLTDFGLFGGTGVDVFMPVILKQD
jgi:parallel beta-helix repeat protein